VRTEQAILSQLDASAGRGVRPDRARAALAEVRGLAAELAGLEWQLETATKDAESTLQAAARHLIAGGGKRIRPTLTLLACGACGGELAAAVPLACAAELTHSATLLHDDVIDDGPIRRGQPASRTIWGNAVSVLSGDWLLTRALELVAAAPSRSTALPGLLATLRTMVEGEVLQLARKGSASTTEEEYFEVVRGKTASLFAWSAAAGGWAAGARGSVVESLQRFGEEIGIAFQLVDDALDFDADPAALGKKLGTDLLEGKATLPLIYACRAVPSLRARLEALLAEGSGNIPPEVAEQVLVAVKRSGGVDTARATARVHTDSALKALEGVDDGPHRRAMLEAAHALTERGA
jgi:octaprenyl-diphosphate synthase